MSDMTFILAEETHLELLKALEQIELWANLAKGHAYERRWDRTRAYLLAMGETIRKCNEYERRLSSYDANQRPSQS